MGMFDRFAEKASHFTSRAWFFGFCVLLVVLWAPSLPLWGTVDTWQLVINTATTIITFLLVALLQNSQWRGDKATNEKLDAVAGGLADTMEALDLVLDHLDIHGEDTQMHHAAAELRHTVGIEERLSSKSDDHPDGDDRATTPSESGTNGDDQQGADAERSVAVT